MGLFDKLFGRNKKQGHPVDGKPPAFGGDGSTAEEAVVVNCASMGMANRIIDNWISERHGEKGDDWKRTVEMFLDHGQSYPPTLRLIGVETKEEEEPRYVFNIGRPMGATMKLDEILNEDKGSES